MRLEYIQNDARLVAGSAYSIQLFECSCVHSSDLVGKVILAYNAAGISGREAGEKEQRKRESEAQEAIARNQPEENAGYACVSLLAGVLPALRDNFMTCKLFD